jgi:hypothetical protein
MKKKLFTYLIPTLTLATGLAFTIPGTPATAAAAQSGYPTFPGRLYSVAAVSANDVWAVGLEPSSSLIVHWNGRTWSLSQAAGSWYYEGVAAISARDVWAVGGSNWFSPSQPFIEHWNGKSWTQVAVPNPPGGGYLTSVAATSASNAWAVGLVGPGPGDGGPQAPLIEHWNGKAWTIQSFQAAPAGSEFAGVAALSPSDAWAVGWTGSNSQGIQQTLIEHWNGKAWTLVPSWNQPGATSNVLHGVTAVSAGNAWAVGNTILGGRSKMLALHWNGQHWTPAHTSTPGGDGALIGVTASWTNNIWAVGYTNPTQCGNSSGPGCQTLIEHWNSVAGRWRLIPSPNPPSDYLNILEGISAVSRTNIWAVGSTDWESTIIVHWNGSTWS